MVPQIFWESHIFCRLFLSHNCNAVGGTLQLSASKKVHRIFQECAVCKKDKKPRQQSNRKLARKYRGGKEEFTLFNF